MGRGGSLELKTLRKGAGEPGLGARPGELTWLCSWRTPGKSMSDDSGVQSLLRPQLGAVRVSAGSFLLPPGSGTPVVRQPPAPPHIQPPSPLSCPPSLWDWGGLGGRVDSSGHEPAFRAAPVAPSGRLTRRWVESNHLKEVSPEYSWEGLMLKLKRQ